MRLGGTTSSLPCHQERLFQLEQQIAVAAQRAAVEREVRETNSTRRWMRGLRTQAETMPLQPLTRSVSPWSRDPILQAEAIDTSPVSFSQLQLHVVLHLVELFAGACCSILVAHRKAGHKISKYTSVEMNPVARKVTRHFLAKLQQRYPHLLPLSAI